MEEQMKDIEGRIRAATGTSRQRTYRQIADDITENAEDLDMIMRARELVEQQPYIGTQSFTSTRYSDVRMKGALPVRPRAVLVEAYHAALLREREMLVQEIARYESPEAGDVGMPAIHTERIELTPEQRAGLTTEAERI